MEMYKFLKVIDFLSMDRVVEMRLETSVVSNRHIGEPRANSGITLEDFPVMISECTESIS
jgi:hypothetical protein